MSHTNWEWYYLKDLSSISISNGVFNDPKNVGLGYRLINVVDLYTEPSIDVSKLKQLNITEKDFKKYNVIKGDIFFTRSSLKLEGIAHCNIFDSDENDVIFECHIMRIRPIVTRINPKFMRLYCISQLARKYFMKHSKTTTMTTIDQDVLGRLLVPVPPIEEQDSIVNIFAKCNRSIELTQSLIKTKQERRKWLMQQLLTGKRRMPKFKKSKDLRKTPFGTLPADWGYPRIGDVAKEVSERNGNESARSVLSCTKHQGLVDSLTYFGKRIFSEDLSNYKIVRRGQFAYATNHIDEGSIGYQGSYDEALISPIYTVFQTNDTMDELFLFLILKTETYRHIFASNTSASVDRRGSLRWNDFAKIHVPHPSIEEQQAIVNIIETADRELELLRSQLDALKEQKKGLMQQLLTGKLRVKM